MERRKPNHREIAAMAVYTFGNDALGLVHASHGDFGDVKMCVAWAIQKDREVQGHAP